MQTLPSEESRRILDAMGIPVVVLREDSHEATAASETTTAESGPGRGVSELVAVLEKKAVLSGEAVETEKEQMDVADHEASDRAVIRPDSPDQIEESKPLRFTLVSAATADVLLACELPAWAGGLLEGRLTGLCSDLLRTLSPSTDDVDWQYFHWPIAGIKDHGREAATDAFLDLAAATLAACGNSDASVGAFTDLALPCLADSFRSEPGKRPYVVKILFMRGRVHCHSFSHKTII